MGINTKQYLTIKQWNKKTHLHIQTVNFHVHDMPTLVPRMYYLCSNFFKNILVTHL